MSTFIVHDSVNLNDDDDDDGDDDVTFIAHDSINLEEEEDFDRLCGKTKEEEEGEEDNSFCRSDRHCHHDTRKSA